MFNQKFLRRCLGSGFNRARGSRQSRLAPASPLSRRSHIEHLEPRTLLTAVLVNTIDDNTHLPQSGVFSLRDAIAAANASTTPTTITFDTAVFGASPTTITLTSGLVLNSAQATSISCAINTVIVDGHSFNALTISNTGATITGLAILHALTGIVNSASIVLNNVTIGQGTGGGIVNTGSLTINSSAIVSNTSAASGGGISTTSAGHLTINSSTITGNQAPDGGGIYIAGGSVMTLNTVLITGNSATGSAGRGGGILNQQSNAVINGCTIGNNGAVTGAGLDDGRGTTFADNSTFSGNTATGNGGGISNGDPANPTGAILTLENCTIASNTALSGGGLYTINPCVTNVGNTIIASNAQTSSANFAPDAAGTQASQGHNLIGIVSATYAWTGLDLVGGAAAPLDPKLLPLDRYSGLIPTMALKPGSLALDAGSKTLAVNSKGVQLNTDERGFLRTFNGTVDIGAFEFQPVQINATIGNDTINLNGTSTNLTWSIGSATGNFILADAEPVVINGNGSSDIIQMNVPPSDLPAHLKLNGTFTLDGWNFNGQLFGCTLDIGTSTVYVFHANLSFDVIPLFRQYLLSGYNGALWNGTDMYGAIISSNAAANPSFSTGIGYVDSAEGVLNLPPATIELKYTLYGDTGLAGSVGFTDFMRMTQHYTKPTDGTWLQGDFNYDGAINSIDFNLLKPNYGTTLPAPAMTPIAVAPVSPVIPTRPARSTELPPPTESLVTDGPTPATPAAPAVPIDPPAAKKHATKTKKHH